MQDYDDLTSIFKDLQISVFSKASRLSSVLETNTESSENVENTGTVITNFAVEFVNRHHQNDKKVDNTAAVTYSSTPKSKNWKNGSLQTQSSTYDHKIFKNIFDRLDLSPVSQSKNMPENSFTTQKLLHLYDLERCLTVEKVMTERIQNMYDTDKLIHDSHEHLKQARLEEASTKWLLLEQKILDDFHDQEIRNRPKREAQLAEDTLKNAQRVIERNRKVKDAENEARKKSEAIILNHKRQDKIRSCQKVYGQQYVNIISLMNSFGNKNLLMERANHLMKDLKNYSAECESIFKKAKTSVVSEEDIDHLDKLIEMIKQVYKGLNDEIEAINLESKKLNELNMESVKEEVKEEANTTAEQTDLSDCFDSHSLQTYFSLKSYMENFDEACKNLTKDSSLKTFRFNCLKAVTIPVNAISPVSSSHLSDKYFKLHNLLSGKIVDVGELQVSASQHPEGIPYCKKILAKKFVRQGDLTVSSKPDAAFSIAAVLASLWVDFPDFGQLALAYFQNACPYLAPVFLPQLEGQSTEEYHKSLGYCYTQNGEVEKQDSFLKRMSGIMRLYSALLISKVRQPSKQSPLGISEGWRWMSAMLNLEPRPDICATLLFDFLEVTGSEMLRVYGIQFKKLLAYICQVYFPKLEKITPAGSRGPLVRLEEFLQKIMKTESIPPPDGLLPPNFW